MGDQLKKLVTADDDENDFNVRFDTDENSGAPKERKFRGTGFVQVDQLKKLLADQGDDDDDDHAVHFVVDDVEDDSAKQRKYRGTGFVSVEQLNKLLLEAGEEDEDEEYRKRMLAEFRQFDAEGQGTMCRLRMEAILRQAMGGDIHDMELQTLRNLPDVLDCFTVDGGGLVDYTQLIEWLYRPTTESELSVDGTHDDRTSSC